MNQIQPINSSFLAEVERQITTLEKQIADVLKRIDTLRARITHAQQSLADRRVQIAQERPSYFGYGSQQLAALQKDYDDLTATFDKEKKEHNLLVTKTKNAIHLLQGAIDIPGINREYVKIKPSPYAAACVYV